MRIRESAVARGVGVGLAVLQSSPSTRAQTLGTAYAVGHALDPKGFTVVSIGGMAEAPQWQRQLVPLLTGGASWAALHSVLIPLVRRTRWSVPVVAVTYALVETLLDSAAAEWQNGLMAKYETQKAAQMATGAGQSPGAPA